MEDLGAPPDSWEVADLDLTMSRLMLSSSCKIYSSSSNQPSISSSSTSPPEPRNDVSVSGPALSTSTSSGTISEDLINSVDQFLREALQKPRERLSGLHVIFWSRLFYSVFDLLVSMLLVYRIRPRFSTLLNPMLVNGYFAIPVYCSTFLYRSFKKI